MKTTWYFFIIALAFTGCFSMAHYYTDFAYHIHTLVFILCISLLSRDMINVQHLVCLLLIATLIEAGSFYLIQNVFSLGKKPYQINFMIFVMHFTVDLLSFILIKRRVRLSMNYVKKFQSSKREYIYMTHADIILVGIFFLFMLVDLAAFAENIIRNLEHFGVDESFAKQFWKWGIVYYSYPYVKSVLLAAVITTLLATIYVERFRPAPIKESEEDLTLKKSESQHRP